MSGSKPDFAASLPILTSRSTSRVLAASFAAALILLARRNESTESTASNSSTVFAALFDCRCPMRWKCEPLSFRASAALVANSCTRFSPKMRSPDSYASRIAVAGKVLLTPMSVIPLPSRPARAAASWMRSRMRAMFSAIKNVLSVLPGAQAEECEQAGDDYAQPACPHYDGHSVHRDVHVHEDA